MSSPPDSSDDGSNATSSNYTLLYIVVAVLIGVILYVVVRYGRSVLAEYRELQAGHGARFGLTAEEVAALPTFTYRVRASPLPSHGRKGRMGATLPVVECVVCLQELEDGDVVRVLPSCRHFFHGGRIDVWLRDHTSCPVCRADLEPECHQLTEAVSPPLPQLRRCGVSPERSSPSRVLADILSRSPLRSPSPGPMAYARVDDQWRTKTPSPAGLSEIRVVRSKTPSPIGFSKQQQHLSPSPRRIGVLESAEVITSAAAAPVVPEIVIARSMTPSPTRLNRQLSARSSEAVERMEAISTLNSPSPMRIGEGGGGSLSKSSSPVHTIE